MSLDPSVPAHRDARTWAIPGPTLALAAPLVIGGPSATVRFPRSGTDEPARWAQMPLNSRAQNLHHHYVTDLSTLVPLAAGDGLIVQLPGASGGTFTFFSGGIASGNVLGTFDPAARLVRRVV